MILMANLDDVQIFVKVAQFESISRAAHSLGMPNSTVSRRLKPGSRHRLDELREFHGLDHVRIDTQLVAVWQTLPFARGCHDNHGNDLEFGAALDLAQVFYSMVDMTSVRRISKPYLRRIDPRISPRASYAASLTRERSSISSARLNRLLSTTSCPARADQRRYK